MSEEAAISKALLDAGRLAEEMLRLAKIDEMQAVTDLACRAYKDEPHLLPMVMSIWHTWAREAHGELAVHDLVEKVSLNIADAPVDEPRTRAAFCDMLFAMEDGNAERVRLAWIGVMERGGWDTAVEVLSLMIGFTAYFLGWSTI